MTLKEHIVQRASQYAKEYDKAELISHDIKMKSPILYVLFGSGVQGGLENIQEAMSDYVLNAEGAIYLLIGGDAPEKLHKQVVHLPLPKKQGEIATGRKDLGECIRDDDFLKLLGEKITEVQQKIMENGRIFNYWKQMSICTITMASDIENVLLSDIMILLKHKLSQQFKQIFMDLYIVIEETTKDATAVNKAFAMSFFKEVSCYESYDFSYKQETEVVEDGLKLDVSYRGQLFDLVYVLTDKKETGQRIEEALSNHYETITAINLLKNKEVDALEIEEASQQFNYNVFSSNIKQQSQERYCSAKLARVKKPRQGIYLATGYYLFKNYKQQQSIEQTKDDGMLLSLAYLTEEKINELVKKCLPQQIALNEMQSLISTNVNFNTLKSGSFKDAEDTLYGQMAKQFFDLNFRVESERQLSALISSETFKQELIEKIINNPRFGPYTLLYLMEANQLQALSMQREKYEMMCEQLENGMQEAYAQIVGVKVSGKISLFDKKKLYDVKDYLINEIYGYQYKILVERLKIKALDKVKETIEALYQEVNIALSKLEEVEGLLKEMIINLERYEEDYLVQNVEAYYSQVVEKKLKQQQELHGTYFLYEEKMIGPIIEVLNQDPKVLVDKVFNIVETYILNDETYFKLSFENELLARANMCIEYEEKQIAAKGKLYELLYDSLEENSKPCVHLQTLVSGQYYTEKYFFGDKHSEFIDFAYKKDYASRSYKIGTINDQRSSIIEKLQLMGGFKLQDLVFYESALRYYNAYKEKQYIFHTEEMAARIGEDQVAK